MCVMSNRKNIRAPPFQTPAVRPSYCWHHDDGWNAGVYALVALHTYDVSVHVLQVGTGVQLFWLPRQPTSQMLPKLFSEYPDSKS